MRGKPRSRSGASTPRATSNISSINRMRESRPLPLGRPPCCRTGGLRGNGDTRCQQTICLATWKPVLQGGEDFNRPNPPEPSTPQVVEFLGGVRHVSPGHDVQV